MKNVTKRLLSVLLAVIMVLSILPMAGVTSFAVTSGDFRYKVLSLTDKTCEITGYIGSATNLTIPSTIDGYTVMIIGDSAFENCTSLTSVTIPNSVTSIGWYAFEDCSSLKSVTIPDSVTSIDSYAFYNTAYSNNENNWENGVLYIGKHLIEAKEDISGSYTIKSGTRTIADGAFGGCTSLTSVTIPDSVTSIGFEAFLGCSSLASVTIPDSVTSIDGCAFYNCTSLTKITIPDSVTSIGGLAFYNTAYYNDENNWENGVLYIGKHLIEAKEDISGSYTIKSGTRTIADGAFGNCTSLTGVNIPDSVTSIVDSAFGGCDSLASINVDENNMNYSSLDGVLFNKNKTGLLQYSVGNTRISYIIPDSVTSIGSEAFEDCTSLTSVTIPDSVTSIGYAAFLGCTSLKSVIIPVSVTSIGNSAFYGCTSLTSVTIPASVTSIGYAAFLGCTSLTSVTIPDSVTEIDYLAFGYYYNYGHKKIDGFTICGYEGSAAENYAKENEFKFVVLEVASDISMYRLYNKNSGEHFYTADINEKNNLVSLGWNDEGIGWTAPVTSSAPVYRLYNKEGGEHHYTTDINEKNYLVSLGWNDEGIGWYSDDAKGVALYRQYNPNAFANNHNYTTDKGENDWLVGLGWRAEGIGWYGVA